MSGWKKMEKAPRDGTTIKGNDGLRQRVTWYGKTSHVPLYGWCFMEEPGDFENVELWEPIQWRPLTAREQRAIELEDAEAESNARSAPGAQ